MRPKSTVSSLSPKSKNRLGEKLSGGGKPNPIISDWHPKTSPRPFGLGLTRRIQQILSTKASSRHFHSSAFKATSVQLPPARFSISSLHLVVGRPRLRQ